MPDRDAPPTPEALLQHASFVRALARGLLRHPADEDDAVQATWQAALERPPARRSTARAWLAAVLRNRVREDHRRRTRRHAREERVARRARVESTADAVVRHETVRTIVDAVFALDEPYRTSILLRYYEDLPPRHIAARMGVPVETVKSRLKRARAKLREALGGRHGPGPWVLAPLATPGGTLERLGEIGAAIVGTKVKVIGAAALAAVALWTGAVVLDDPPASSSLDAGLVADADRARQGEDAGPSLVAAGTDPAVRERRASGPVRTAPSTGPQAADSTEGRRKAEAPSGLHGVVTVDGAPVSGGRVRARGDGGRALEGTIDADGRFRIEDVPAGPWRLEVTLPEGATRQVMVSLPQESDQGLRVAFGTARLHGRVYDEFGRTRAEASVRLSGGRGSLRVRATTDADGRYAFEALPEGTYYIVGDLAAEAASRARNIRSFKIELAVGEERELDLGEPFEDGHWIGRVRYADGTPVLRSGNIFLQHVDGTRRMYVSFDKEGKYSAQVPNGRWRMEYVFNLAGRAFGMGRMRAVPTSQELVMRAGEVRQDAIIPGARIVGRVRGLPEPSVKGAARPGGAAQVLRFERKDPVAKEGPEPLIAKRGAVATIHLAADGTYAFDGLAPGRYMVSASPRALDREVVLEVPDGQDLVRCDLDIGR